MLGSVAQFGRLIDREAGEEHRGSAGGSDATERQRARDAHIERAIVQELLEEVPSPVISHIKRRGPPSRPSALAHISPLVQASRTHLLSASPA